MVVVQTDEVNRSRLGSVPVVAITSNTDLAAWPGNVFVPAGTSGLRRNSVVNVTALGSVGRVELDESVGMLPLAVMHEVDRGLRHLLGL